MVRKTISFNRILLKISGEVLAGEKSFGIDPNLTQKIATKIKAIHSNNIQIGVVTVVAVVPGIIGAMVISRILSAKIGKRKAAVICGMVALILTPVPYALRIYGLAPEFGSNGLLLLMSFYYFIEVSTGVAVTILVSSMVSDIVEDSELTTKKRSEGIFFSAQGFSNKAVSGIGIFLAGLVTSLAGLPTDAKPGNVDDSILINVALIFVPIYMVLYFNFFSF